MSPESRGSTDENEKIREERYLDETRRGEGREIKVNREEVLGGDCGSEPSQNLRPEFTSVY